MTTQKETQQVPGLKRDRSNKSDYNEILLQVKEVAELLGIHRSTVRIWADSGVLQSFRIGPRSDRRIPLSAIQSMLAPISKRG